MCTINWQRLCIIFWNTFQAFIKVQDIKNKIEVIVDRLLSWYCFKRFYQKQYFYCVPINKRNKIKQIEDAVNNITINNHKFWKCIIYQHDGALLFCTYNSTKCLIIRTILLYKKAFYNIEQFYEHGENHWYLFYLCLKVLKFILYNLCCPCNYFVLVQRNE